MKFKKLFLAMACLHMGTISYANQKSINPEKTTQDLHYLYKNISFDSGYENVTLNGPKFQGVNGFAEIGVNSTLSAEEYVKQVSWSQSVFPATVGTGKGNGTAFFVGGNLVLTNRHVVGTDNFKKDCGVFDIEVKFPFSETIACKEVHYCSSQSDFCLVEMENFKNGDSLSKHLPAFVLKDTKKINEFGAAYGIGNAVGYGIQGSKANFVWRDQVSSRSLETVEVFIHHVPTYGGSSGSPIFLENGEVIGINFAERIFADGRFRAAIGNSLYNLAVPMDIVLKELREHAPKQLKIIGKSDVKFLNPNNILKKLELIYHSVNHEKNFDLVLEMLQEVNTFEEFYKLTSAEKTRINGEELVNDLKLNNLNLESALKVIIKDQLDLKSKILELIEKEIFDKYASVLKDKQKYLLVQEDCLRFNPDKKAVDGCIFENIYNNTFMKAMNGLPFDDARLNLIWEELARIIKTSSNANLYFTNKQMDTELADLAFEEISRVKFFVGCFLTKNKRFKEVTKEDCQNSVESTLIKNGFINPSEKLSMMVFNRYHYDSKYSALFNNFNYQVLNVDFQCFLGNKKCKREKYKRNLKNWGHLLEMSSIEIEQFLDILVKYHRR